MLRAKRGIGDLARGSLKAVEFAETLQGAALDSIRDLFAATSAFDFDLGVSHEEFVKGLTEAEESGKRDEFEAFLAQQMAGSWAMFQQMQQQAMEQSDGAAT